MQKDIVLRVPMCGWEEISACADTLSNHKVMATGETGVIDYIKVSGEDGGTRAQHMCERAVPGACPRVQCLHKTTDTVTHEPREEFRACRLLGFIQSQQNESGFWMKLPCSKCKEERQLHETTKEFVYSEDEGGN